jgi:hypothetical protein
MDTIYIKHSPISAPPKNRVRLLCPSWFSVIGATPNKIDFALAKKIGFAPPIRNQHWHLLIAAMKNRLKRAVKVAWPSLHKNERQAKRRR